MPEFEFIGDYTITGILTIEANSLDEAKRKVKKMSRGDIKRAVERSTPMAEAGHGG